MERSLVVIGAGVAGLTAGRFAARNGYRTTILESASTPGGLCTSWKQKGYQFDGSVAGLSGSAPEAPIYSLSKDVGVIDSCEVFDPDSFGSFRCTYGTTVTIYTDVDRLAVHLRDTCPETIMWLTSLPGPSVSA